MIVTQIKLCREMYLSPCEVQVPIPMRTYLCTREASPMMIDFTYISVIAMILSVFSKMWIRNAFKPYLVYDQMS